MVRWLQDLRLDDIAELACLTSIKLMAIVPIGEWEKVSLHFLPDQATGILLNTK
jgi:hypothetical protein